MSYERNSVEERLNDFKKHAFISERNKELVDEFIQYLKADRDVGRDRQYKYISNLKTIFRSFVDFDLDTASKADMRRAIGEIHSSDYSEWTQRDFKVVLKKIYHTLYEEEHDRPENIKRILDAKFMKTSSKPERKKQIEALEPDEILAMVDAASNRRNKLLPLFFFETGARITEIRNIQLKDIELKRKYAEVEVETLKNDKGSRQLQLTRCVAYLQQYLDVHPCQDDEAYLFVNMNGPTKGEQMSGRNIRKILNELADSAEIDKRTHPHAFRHAAATHKGMKWSTTRMMYWFGWKDSSRAETYCHENEDRMRKARLKEEGIETTETHDDPTEQKKCGRCGEKWPVGQKYCGNCSLSLDSKVADETKELETAIEHVIKKKMNDEGMQEMLDEYRAQNK